MTPRQGPLARTRHNHTTRRPSNSQDSGPRSSGGLRTAPSRPLEQRHSASQLSAHNSGQSTLTEPHRKPARSSSDTAVGLNRFGRLLVTAKNDSSDSFLI